MDYSYYSSQPQQVQYGGLNGSQQHLFPGSDRDLSAADVELFRGLNNIGSSFDAYTQLSPQGHFAPPSQQHNTSLYPPREASLSGATQPIQPPKSLSPDSLNGEPTLHHLDGDTAPNRQPVLTGPISNSMDPADPSGGFAHARSSSEEKDHDSMPAQDRRKAQNRAAQRAFRERKEKHVKELEAKLESLSQASSSLQSDNERLKRELAAISTQNEILRATHTAPRSTTSLNHPYHPPEFHAPRAPSPTPGPQSFSPTEFVLATGGSAAWPLKFDAYPNQRGRMLLAGAAWDLIVRDPRVAEGKIDLEEVCRRLKGRSICDGRGPAFREEELRHVLDECAIGGDDLL